MTVRITPSENGPYIVEGLIQLVDGDGRPIPMDGGEIYRCRCGASAQKPFCDGSHNGLGFKAA